LFLRLVSFRRWKKIDFCAENGEILSFGDFWEFGEFGGFLAKEFEKMLEFYC
jgi:hypothetical protein